MDRDALYYHFANLGLVLIGLFSIQVILNPFVAVIVISGTVAGFLVSWQIRDSRPQHIDTFLGMLSLAAMVIILGMLWDTALSFETLLKIFSTALAWLTLFQSFGLKTGKSYAMLQFISASLLISSVGLALEGEIFYVVLLGLFLFIFIFVMRLNLVCEKNRSGSVIIGDQREIMGLQIKVCALMFSFILIFASFVYPFVPRFENLSLKWVPSTLLGIPEQVPLLALLQQAPKTIKESKRRIEEQVVDDRIRRRETAKKKREAQELVKEAEGKDERIEIKGPLKRFPAKEFSRDIDIFKIESLNIRSDKDEVPVGSRCKLRAELKLDDGSSIPVTRLVDWKVIGEAGLSIDGDGNLIPKEQGYVQVSASYMGSFSNDLRIKITGPLAPIKKKQWLRYLFIIPLWLVILGLSFFAVRVFMKSKRLSKLAVRDPKEFIKEIYLSLRRGLKVFGVPKLDYVTPTEFLESAKDLVSKGPEPMHVMIDGLLEVRFSAHEISTGHSQKMLGLFHEVKKVILQRGARREFCKKVMFRLLLLDVSLLPRRH